MSSLGKWGSSAAAGVIFTFLFYATSGPAWAHVGHDGSTVETRSWRLNDGSRVDGAILAVNGDRLALRQSSGDIVHVPILQLAAKDRLWVEERVAAIGAKVNAPQPITEDRIPSSVAPASPTIGRGTDPLYFWAVACAVGAILSMLSMFSRRRCGGGPALAAVGMLCSGAVLAVAADDAKPQMSAIQKAFSGFRNKVHTDANYLYVESDGLPDHPMMKGIRSWQQQVPLPQAYTGNNAWRIPLKPVLADKPISARNALFRGAIALAVNGVPIFNAKNNRGDDALLAGELDEWGGHCGRADDYHYHAAPLHLQKIVGNDQPIAYALDGFPIYGLTNPDGSPVGKLDEFNGKIGPDGSYRYHATKEYPYINGGLRGAVEVRNDGIEPQPRAAPVRPALPPLRGATITELKALEKNRFELNYEIGGKKGSVTYGINADGTYPFTFKSTDGTQREEVFRRRTEAGPPPGGGDEMRGRRGDRPPRRDGNNRPPRQSENPPPPPPREGERGGGRPAEAELPAPVADISRPLTGFTLSSPAVGADGMLPKEFTGDGESASPPLTWSGAPAGTKSFVLIMHHVPPGGGAKWYWTLYDIPPDTKGLEKNARDIGKAGTNSVNGRTQYAPPHSKGPGKKVYVLTLYALSSTPRLETSAERVDRNALLTAMKENVLGTATLEVLCDRTGVTNGGGAPRDARGD